MSNFPLFEYEEIGTCDLSSTHREMIPGGKLLGMALVSTQKALSLVQEQVAGHRGVLGALRPTAIPNIQRSSTQTDSRQSGHRGGPYRPCFHHLPPSLLQLEFISVKKHRWLDDPGFCPSLSRKRQEKKIQGVNERRGEVLGSEETDTERVGSDWCCLDACMRVYLVFSVFSAVSLSFSLSLSLSLWCSCQSTDCRSVSALHTLSLRPECRNADTELLTVAWTNT